MLFARRWLVKIRYITIAVVTICFVQNPLVQAAGNTVRLRLFDANKSPIARISLTAWQVNNTNAQGVVCTGLDGTVLFNLPPGQYYFTGNITELKTRTIYAKGLKNSNETTFYFISAPVIINNKPENVAFTIDSANYINITDIARLHGFKLHISQKDLGIGASIHLGADHNNLRLYLPLRMQYIVQQAEGISHMQWPIYAAPGAQFILPF